LREYAKVSPRLWTGQLGQKLKGDPEAQAMASYLVSGPNATMIGLYRLPMEYAAADLGWTFEGASEALRRVCAAGLAKHDSQNQRIWVIESARHEFGESLAADDKRVKGIENKLADHEMSFLANDFRAYYGAAFHLSGRRKKKALKSPSEAPSKPGSGAGAGTDTQSATSDDFDAFWSAYPRKVAKEEARKAWEQTAARRPPLPDLLAAVGRAKATDDWKREGGRFAPHAATWLRASRWTDEFPTSDEASGPNGAAYRPLKDEPF
jgi:hypothetical protein